MVEETKNDEHTNVLIPWYPVSYLTIASSVFFFGRLRVPTRRCDLVVPADGGWGRSNKPKGAAPWGQFFGGRGEWPFWYTDFREERNPPQADIIIVVYFNR